MFLLHNYKIISNIRWVLIVNIADKFEHRHIRFERLVQHDVKEVSKNCGCLFRLGSLFSLRRSISQSYPHFHSRLSHRPDLFGASSRVVFFARSNNHWFFLAWNGIVAPPAVGKNEKLYAFFFSFLASFFQSRIARIFTQALRCCVCKWNSQLICRIDSWRTFSFSWNCISSSSFCNFHPIQEIAWYLTYFQTAEDLLALSCSLQQ